MLQRLRTPGFFITGTDTGVGKTIIAGAIAQWFARQGKTVGVFKPIATGCVHRREGLVSEDSEMLAHCADTRHPLDVAANLKAPVLGLYGAADAGIPLDTVDKMKAALAAGSPAAKASQFVVYPDAPHAFHADYRPTFRQGPAEDGWKRALEWFRTHGVA